MRTRHFEQPRTHEEARLQSIIATQEHELNHRANVIAALADRVAECEAELDASYQAGAYLAHRGSLDRVVGLTA